MTKIKDLMYDIANFNLVLPEFQREYVWTKEQAKSLISSLYRGYPTGSLLFWKTTNPPEIKHHDAIPPEKIGALRVILDGQQRLTTLYLLIQNETPPYYREADIQNDPRGLHFNLQEGVFEYYQKTKMARSPVWQPVTRCFAGAGGIHVFEIAKALTTDPEELMFLAEKMTSNLQRLKLIAEREYPIQLVPSDADIDTAIDVFDVVNSKGTKLRASELALAHISGKWSDARRHMKHKIEEMGKRGFEVDLGFMVRCLTTIVKGRARFDAIHNVRKEALTEGWEKQTRAIDFLMNILPASAHVDSAQDLNTTNVLVPLVTYCANAGYSFRSQMEQSQAIRWLYAANMWARYTSQTDSRLDNDVSIVLGSESPWEDLVNPIIDQRGRIEVSPNDLEGRSALHPLYKMTYIIAKGKGAIDWFNGVPLARPYGPSYSIQSHHIFPSGYLYHSGKYSSDNHLHVKLVNEIANRAFLTREANIKLGDTPPAQYLPEVERRFPGALENQFIPMDSSLWELDRYEEFLAARRKLIADAINSYMEKLLRDTSGIRPVVSLDELLQVGESDTLEYKSSLRWDWKLNQVNKTLQKVVAKTVAGFFNTKGGTLLIGVADSGTIVGIEQDIQTLNRKDTDGFYQALIGALSHYLGAEYTPYISTRFEPTDQGTVAIVTVSGSPEPVFLSDKGTKEFYIRAGNTTTPLDPEETHKYIEMHWHH